MADFAHFFAKCIFCVCDEAAKLVLCGLEGFYPPKTARKGDPKCFFQNLLNDSVNSVDLV